MSYTRLCVESTESPMGHARKRRILSFLMELSENTRRQNSLLIIITTKNDKQAFKKSENSIQRGRKLDLKGIYQHSMLSLNYTLFLLAIVLYMLSPPISNLFLLCSVPPPPLIGIGPKHSTRQRLRIQRGIEMDLKRLQQE